MVSKTKENEQDVLPEGDLKDKDFDPEEHVFESHILAAKSWVTPLKTRLTVLRSEVLGVLLD